MTHVTVDRAEGKLLRAYTHPESDAQHPGEVEIRLLSADYFGNHIRHVEYRAYFTEKEIGDILEAMLYRKIVESAQQTDVAAAYNRVIRAVQTETEEAANESDAAR